MDTLPVTESLPTRLCAGDAVSLSIQTGQPSTSTLKIALTAVINNVPTRYLLGPIVIAADGTAPVELASTVTASWLPGRYDWIAVAIDGTGNRTQLAQGSVAVAPDPLAATPADPRSYNRKMLDQIRALRQGKALDDVFMYKIGTRELTHCSHAELRTLEAEYEQRVRSERIRDGENVPTRNKGINFGGRR